MTISNFTDICKDTFNVDERLLIEQAAEKMFRENGVRTYLPVGKKEVCLERESSCVKTIEVFLMNETLDMNDQLVNRFNKRHKNKAGSRCVNS